MASNTMDKSKKTTLLLCIFLGTLGVHRFYSGKIITGLIWLFTLGLYGIGWIIDIVLIATDNFSTKQQHDTAPKWIDMRPLTDPLIEELYTTKSFSEVAEWNGKANDVITKINEWMTKTQIFAEENSGKRWAEKRAAFNLEIATKTINQIS